MNVCLNHVGLACVVHHRTVIVRKSSGGAIPIGEVGLFIGPQWCVLALSEKNDGNATTFDGKVKAGLGYESGLGMWILHWTS